MSVHVFGIRHHGPGSARSLRQALEALEPDAVLVEGPPDAADVLSLVGDSELEPPVALLVYPKDEPSRAVFYPFTVFSPEWQALRYAVEHDVTARFMDLPHAIRMARTNGDERSSELTEDPIGVLAEAAGYDDRELWWEHQVERRRDATGLFAGVLEAMTALRAEIDTVDEAELRREAWMRQTIRAARKDGFERIAVVCGAWHAPALAEIGPARGDRERLKGLRKIKVAATWIPWTHSRLSYTSGYGAGVESPGWYHHVWTSPERAAVRWLVDAARLLRSEDLDAPAANVIEAVRLAEALAALRELPLPGLRELRESIRAVLCRGEDTPMALVRRRLEIGERLGSVPGDAPAVPLRRDLEAEQKRWRLKPAPEARELVLDLRKDLDRGRSRLLHRLRLLNVDWGEPDEAYGAKGTFKEPWWIEWQPELTVRIVEASLHGNTVESAATGAVGAAAEKARSLEELTALLDRAVLAELPEAVERVLGILQDQAALASDVRHLMDALPPLARAARYGDVRGTRSERLVPVVDGIFERTVVGLPGACASLDDGASAAIVESIAKAGESVHMLERREMRRGWFEVLRRLLADEGVHGLVRGHACRLLFEGQALDGGELERRARLALSPAQPPRTATAWLEGLLRGSGLTLLHLDELWTVLDGWLAELGEETFTELLPLLRRAFSGFQPAERRQMGEKLRHLDPGMRSEDEPGEVSDEIDPERSERVLPVLAQVLGVRFDG